MAEPQDPTEPTPRLPRQDARASEPGASQQPAGPPPPGAPPPGQPPGGTQASGAYPPGPPPRRPGLWRQATSTTGGTVAVAVAAAALALLMLGAIGLGALVVARTVASDHGEDRMEQLRDRGFLGDNDGRVPPGMQDRGSAGDGLGQLMRGAFAMGAMGAVEHGEFTVTGADGKATVMTVQRGTVTAVSDTSLALRSTDGFTATYKLDDATRGGADLAKDDTAFVIARKAGATAVVVREVRAR